MTITISRTLFVSLVAFAVWGCTPTVSDPTVENVSFPPSLLAWSCYDDSDPHCLNTPPEGDPSPTASGIYLGETFTWDECTSAFMNDSDFDGIADFCEYQIALVFRPMLATNSYDIYLDREEYWAVEAGDGQRLKIAYAFGYYADGGCDLPVGFCAGHWGDSEFLIATVSFDNSTQHWQMDSQVFSAHYLESYPGADNTTEIGYRSLQYPTRDRYYTRVWVSLKKHANYHTKTACESATIYVPLPVKQDECGANSDSERFNVRNNRNLGSSSARFLNLVYSTDPGRQGPEWYWNYVRFCGWSNTATYRPEDTCSTSYATILNTFMGPPSLAE